MLPQADVNLSLLGQDAAKLGRVVGLLGSGRGRLPIFDSGLGFADLLMGASQVFVDNDALDKGRGGLGSQGLGPGGDRRCIVSIAVGIHPVLHQLDRAAVLGDGGRNPQNPMEGMAEPQC